MNLPQLTKKLIMDCTLALAEKRPLNKITVRDIVEECGITRNTFYYYFHDIYDVLDGVIEEKLVVLRKQYPTDPDGAFFALLEFAASHKKVWLNLYKTLGYDELGRFIMKQIRGFVVDVFSEERCGTKISPADLEIICSFYEEAIYGTLVRWLKDERDKRTPAELMLYIDRMQRIFRGQTELILTNLKSGK